MNQDTDTPPISQPSADPQPEARVPVADIERRSDGRHVDLTLPEGQIWPWDNTDVQAWIDTEIARLDPLVVDPAIRSIAADLQALANRPEQRRLSPDFKLADNMVGLMFSPNQDEANIARFLLLHTTKVHEPWAYYQLAILVAEEPNPPANLELDLYREAADRDYLPAMVNLANGWEETGHSNFAAREAYLKYGFDLNVSDGHWNITRALINYYIYDHPSAPSDGYLDRALIVMRDVYGERVNYHQDLGHRLFEGIDGPVDKQGALREYLAAVELGATLPLNILGYIYMGGSERGAPYNKDLARDYLVACLMIDPDDSCALNLGSLYRNYTRGSVDLAIAYAFYQFGAEMNGSNRSRLIAEIRDTLPDMSDDEKRLSAAYYSDIVQGDFSQIPHVQNARPVTP